MYLQEFYYGTQIVDVLAVIVLIIFLTDFR